MAQSVEHLPCKQGVRGSSPLVSFVDLVRQGRQRPSQPPGSRLREMGTKARTTNRRVFSTAPARERIEDAAHTEGYPSGQREQTVNLPAMPSMVRIHHPPLSSRSNPGARPAASAARRGRSSVGRASAFQAERRRFEPGRPLDSREILRPQPQNPPCKTSPGLPYGSGTQYKARPASQRREVTRRSGLSSTLAHLAQLVEHFLGKEEVVGSNPMVGST